MFFFSFERVSKDMDIVDFTGGILFMVRRLTNFEPSLYILRMYSCLLNKVQVLHTYEVLVRLNNYVVLLLFRLFFQEILCY